MRLLWHIDACECTECVAGRQAAESSGRPWRPSDDVRVGEGIATPVMRERLQEAIDRNPLLAAVGAQVVGAQVHAVGCVCTSCGGVPTPRAGMVNLSADAGRGVSISRMPGGWVRIAIVLNQGGGLYADVLAGEYDKLVYDDIVLNGDAYGGEAREDGEPPGVAQP